MLFRSTAAHCLRTADPQAVERFLSAVHDPDELQHFEVVYGHYLEALNGGLYDPEAHPHAYLRLLALMPGPVPKDRIERLLARHRIRRLQKGSVGRFARMRLPFVVDTGLHIDLNPMVRSLLRQELERHLDRDDIDVRGDREEVRWIHAESALWCFDRAPKTTEFTVVEIGRAHV